MKRLVTIIFLLCLFFSGCQIESSTVTESVIESNQALFSVTKEAYATDEKTVTTTEEVCVETRPARQEKVKMYLLEKSTIFDSGYTEYHYDENYNIDYYKVFSIENDLMYTVYFEEKDNHGMASECRTLWAFDDSSNSIFLSYSGDGKIKEEREDVVLFCGFQYEYDQKGKLIKKCEYYDNELCSTVYYEYDGSELLHAYSEDSEGNRVFDCQVEKGLIMKKNCYNSDGTFSHTDFFEYDDNGNLVKDSYSVDNMLTPGTFYHYKTVDVDYDHAQYLLEQQKYLLSIL